MIEKKVADGIKETVKEYLELLDDNIPIANYHIGSVTGLSQEIYNKRKKLGLFTLDDIRLDKGKIILEVMDMTHSVYLALDDARLAREKAMADKKSIKVKK